MPEDYDPTPIDTTRYWSDGTPAEGVEWSIETPEQNTGPTDAEKLDYIYRFCQTLEDVFTAVNQSPMARMMPGMPDLSAFQRDDKDE